MNNITVVLRYTNEIAFLNRMASIGMAERVFDEGEGSPLMRFTDWEVNASGNTDQDNGSQFIAGLMAADIADKFPPDNNPAFALVWRSDELDCDENQMPWPTYSVEDRDEDGNGLGTYHQRGVGGIA